jgi:hypothetical protein
VKIAANLDAKDAKALKTRLEAELANTCGGEWCVTPAAPVKPGSPAAATPCWTSSTSSTTFGPGRASSTATGCGARKWGGGIRWGPSWLNVNRDAGKVLTLWRKVGRPRSPPAHPDFVRHKNGDWRRASPDHHRCGFPHLLATQPTGRNLLDAVTPTTLRPPVVLPHFCLLFLLYHAQRTDQVGVARYQQGVVASVVEGIIKHNSPAQRQYKRAREKPNSYQFERTPSTGSVTGMADG